MKKLISIVALSLLLSGCATKINTIQATSQLSKDAFNLKIPNNKSRIYFLAGSCDAPLKKWTCSGAGGIFLNKEYIGGLYKKDVMVADIKPGNYEIAWNYKPTYQEKAFGQKNIPLDVNLNSGDFIIVRLSILPGKKFIAGKLFGIGANPQEYVVTITKDKSLIMNKNVIVPLTTFP
jgi:hypothetical protein